MTSGLEVYASVEYVFETFASHKLSPHFAVFEGLYCFVPIPPR